MRRRSNLILLLTLLPTLAMAQVRPPSPAISEPLREVPASVRAQPLSQGEVTHQVTLAAPSAAIGTATRVSHRRIRLSPKAISAPTPNSHARVGEL